MGENDKLLICIALILLITIVWTILIGIIYKIAEKNATTTKKRIIYDDDDDEEYDNYKEDDEYLIEESLYENVPETKKTVKVASSKTTATKTLKNTNKKKTTKKSTTLNSNKETYVAVRIARAKEDTIYLVPKNTIFQKGDKIKINVDNEIKNATVTKGNYRREKYKSKNVELLDLILEKK